MLLRSLLILWIATGLTVAHSVFAATSALIERALPRLNAARQQTAHHALQDTYTLQGVTGSPLKPNGTGYDWDHRGPNDDKEWAWFLNRHRYLEELYLAYCDSGEARYADKIYAILEDWLNAHLHPPRHMSFSSAWRPLEAARRILESWDIVYLKLWHEPTFPAHLRTPFRDCLEAHGDYLQRHHALYGNHLITEMIALVKVAVLCPDAVNSEEWMRYALNKLDEEYDKQFYPEGAHKELSAHYQRVVALNYQKLLALLQATERTELLNDWTPRVDALWAYFAGISKPNGTAPLNNDSDRESVDHRLHANGHANLANPAESKYYPNAGQVVLRSAQPQLDPMWAFFDIGPRGTDHQHEDHLHLSLSYGDFDVLVDHGRYTYKPGRWRDYFQGPAGHNILTVDGRASQPMPNAASAPLRGCGFLQNGRIAAAWGENSFRNKTGAHLTNWQRCVIRLPDDGLLVLDHLITFSPRTVEGFWHGAPLSNWSLNKQSVQIQTADRAATLSFATSHHTELETTLHTGQKHPTISGWHSERFNKKTPSTTMRYATTINAPTIFAWFFSQNATPIQIQSIDHTGRSVQIRYLNANQQAHQLTVQLPLAKQPLFVSLFK